MRKKASAKNLGGSGSPRKAALLEDEAVAHAVWTLRSADLVAMEQPPTLLEHVLGPPTHRTCLADYGCPRRKDWWWWLRGAHWRPRRGLTQGGPRRP